MNALLPTNVSDLWFVAGWTMVHFLWVGAVVAVVALIGRTMLRGTAPNVRYAFALTFLMILGAIPFVSAAWLVTNASQQATRVFGETPAVSTAVASSLVAPPIVELNVADASLTTPNLLVKTPAEDVNVRTVPAQPSTAAATSQQGGWQIAQLGVFVPYLPWLWLVGTPVTFILLLTGVVGSRRLRNASRPFDDSHVAELVARLTASLRITRRVAVAICDRIAAPVLIGIFRPVILLPPAALTGWSPDELEMVLLHELAHVRRWDNLVNLLQRCLESLLFFHPAVWLLSGWVRQEREACCDASVVARTNQPHAYAELLVALAADLPRSVLFHPAAASAMAAGPLRSRIRQILKMENDPMLISGKSFVTMIAALALVATLGLLYLPSIGQAEPDPRPRRPPLVELNFRLERNSDGDVVLYCNNEVLQEDKISSVMPIEPDVLENAEVTLASNKSIDDNRLLRIVTKLESLGVKKLKLTRADDASVSMTKSPKELAEAMQQAQTMNNLKNLALGLLNHEAAHGAFPPQAKFDTEGKPLLSWRVLLLPILGEAELYNEFKLDEPWDSEHNRKLVERMPAVFKNPRIDEPGKTNYLAVVGQECMFIGTPKLLKQTHVTDGTANTIAIVEADRAVEWTKPEDWNFDRSKPIDGLGQLWGGSFNASYVDGSIHRIQLDKPADEIGILFTRNGGEAKDLQQSAGGTVTAEVGPDGLMEGGLPGESEPDGNRVWPAGIPFPRPEQREISARAWERLGLKLIVATGGLVGKVQIWGSPFATNDIQHPSIINRINGVEVGSFDDLDRVLRMYREGPLKIDCTFYGESGAVDIEFTVEKPGVFNGFSRRPHVSAEAKAANGKFPSLEEQKLADLAYKRLALELEAISDDEYRRVRALGYDGAVRVGGNRFADPFSYGDLLVGLHVWPTTNLEDVGEILNRDDIEELSPLKFYVVRREGGFHTTGQDLVVTGRMQPLQPLRPELSPFAPPKSRRGSVFDQTTPAEKSLVTPGAAAGANPYDTSLRPVTVYSTLPGPPPTLNAPAAKDSRDPFAVAGSGSANGAISDGWGEAKPGAARPLTTASMAPTPVDQLRYSANPFAVPGQPLGAPTPAAVATPVPSSALVAAVPGGGEPDRLGVANSSEKRADPKAKLRYNGMSFDEWRTRWQTELSSGKRTEAVNALAAFARAGFGKEAVDTILDVAGEYDFQMIDGTAEGKLKQTVIAELVTNQRNAPLAKYWLPEIIARTEKEPVKWKWLARNLIGQLRTDDEAVLKELRAIAASDKSPLRSDALAAIIESGKINDADHKLIDSALQSDDDNVVLGTLSLLTYSEPNSGGMQRLKLRYFPKTFASALFNSDDAIRRQARNLLLLLNDKERSRIIAELVAVLNDDARSADHVEALRAIAALNAKYPSQEVEVMVILKNKLSSGKRPVSVAAAAALKMILGKDQYQKPLVDSIGDRLQVKAVQTPSGAWAVVPRDDAADADLINQFNEDVIKEQENLFPPDNNYLGGEGIF